MTESTALIAKTNDVGDVNRKFGLAVCLTSIPHPQIGGKFTATPGGLTNIFMVALTSSMVEIVNK